MRALCAAAYRATAAAAVPVRLQSTAAATASAAASATFKSPYGRKWGNAIRQGSKVRIVLLEQLDNLGYKGEEVQVAPGYARNFLVPKGKAVYATEPNKAVHKVVLPEAEAKANALQREVNMLRARIAAVSLHFKRATSDGDALYSGITSADIVEGLAASQLHFLRIKEKQVRFDGGRSDVIMATGEHGIEIEPRPGLWCGLKAVVESS